jgi:hypothetical protein
MTTATTLPDTEEARYAAFDRLQDSMPSVWGNIRLDHPDESVVVIPSISLERSSAASSGTLMQAMEERALFQLLLLSQPRLRMIYVTSSPVPEEVVEYYLGLLPTVITSHARARLTMVSVGDASPVPLSSKLLARPRLLGHIRSLIPNTSRSHLIPYTTTALERDVAVVLGIPMYAADPRLAPLGSKSGCRQMFEDLGVPCPAGAQDLRNRDDLAGAIARMRRERPDADQLIVKINEGVSGSGNAVLDVTGLAADPAAAYDALDRLEPEAPTLSVADFLEAFTRYGGVVEQRIVGEGLASPSVQMRVLPGGELELLSTHDQLLGGASGQAYLGCIFPADPAYSRLISEPALRIGEHLAGLGVMGRFAVDFVVVRVDGEWRAYAIELNLRKGGTTHPFLTLQFLTDGSYDGDAGEFVTPAGTRKYLVATDHLEDHRLRALTVSDVFDLVARRRLHFDQSRQTGVVFHMLTCVTECGRLGVTAIGDSAEEAWRLYRRAEEVLLADAEDAGRPA